ncbi:MAG: hypothetical protein JWP99_1199 [Devosia sp.]|nr:hypothetical protein [Devosia sp.]
MSEQQARWPQEVALDLEQGQLNPCVGQKLLSETDRVRVWSIKLAPGERIGFHRHVLDYFWTAISGGKAISRSQDGSVVEAVYQPGDTVHHIYNAGDCKVHDLENVGESTLEFLTVEHMQSANQPPALPADVARHERA